MPIDQASYRAWDGRARPRRLVSLAIARTMIRRLMRLRLLRWVARVVPVGVCIVASGWFWLASQGLSDSPLQRALESAFGQVDPLAMAYRMLQPALGALAVLMAGMAGAPLIAEDRRSRALPLYFSRPLTHLDYVLGKLATLLFFLSLVLLLPQVCLYLVQLAFSSADGVALDSLPTLLKTFVPGLATCIVLSAIALGASSLTEKTNQAVLFYFSLVMVAPVLSQVLARGIFDDMDWRAISPLACTERIAAELLPLPRRFDRALGSLGDMRLGAAWLGLTVWFAAGLGALVVRIRRVEVVS